MLSPAAVQLIGTGKYTLKPSYIKINVKRKPKGQSRIEQSRDTGNIWHKTQNDFNARSTTFGENTLAITPPNMYVIVVEGS